MDLAQFAIGSWNRFLTRNLSIHPELVGAEHKFQYEDHQINISLPSSSNLPTEPCSGERLRFNVYTETEGRKIPSQLWVQSVDVTVSIVEKVLLPTEITKHPPNRTDLVTKTQQEALNKTAAMHGIIAEKAFDLWIRTLRWKVDNSSIGRPEISGHQSGWSTYLVAQPDGKEIWIAPVSLVANASKMVTPETWEVVASALQANRTPPVYVDLVMDATEHLKMGDLLRATVEMAMGCEIFLRTLVAERLPTDLHASIAEYLDDANVRRVLDKFFPDILNPEELLHLKKIKSELHQLFDLRNMIVHKGHKAALSREHCEKFLKVSKKLLSLRS